jgi:hypothetical protein
MKTAVVASILASLLAGVLALRAGPASGGSVSFDRLTIPVGNGPGSIAVADVNHDANPDLLVLNTTSETLSVLLGDGHGHFHQAPGPLCPTGKGPNDMAPGDFNADGNLDLVIPNTGTPYLTVLLGDGKGRFLPSAHSPFATTSHPHVHGVAVADFNSDGKLDVVTDSWGNNQILMFLGDGAGNLVLPGRAFDTGKRPYERVRAADFNQDGHADVVTTDLDQNAVSVLLGDGHGGLHDAPGSPFPAGVFPWAVAIDDFNRDGKLDLAVIPYDRDITDPRQLGVSVLLGDGKGKFSMAQGSPFSLAGCRGPDRVAAGDVNGDGLRDIVVSCAQNDKVMMLLGTKSGSFQPESVDVPTGWGGLAVADLNRDGKDDIVVSNNSQGTITVLEYRLR